MNSEFRNIFQGSSHGFSDRIPIGTVPSPVGYINNNFLKRKCFFRRNVEIVDLSKPPPYHADFDVCVQKHVVNII
jgi:hypothetical protein